ncbi:MAG: hypothetical protein QM756_05140 [Polyangiaceae bacterium]
MSDGIFYVKNLNGDLVPAKYLKLPGQTGFVADPNSGVFMPNSAQDPTLVRPTLYDQGGTQLPASEQNPNNYLIVPADFRLNATRFFAQQLDSEGLVPDPIPTGPFSLGRASQLSLLFLENHASGLTPLLSDLINNFVPGGNQDLQRVYETFNGDISHNGGGNEPPVKAFIDAASYNLGLVAYLAGIPVWAVELGGGLLNHISHPSGNQNGIYFNSQVNQNSIEAGYDEGHLVGPAGTLPNNPFSTDVNGVHIITNQDGTSIHIIPSDSNSIKLGYYNSSGNLISSMVLNKDDSESITLFKLGAFAGYAGIVQSITNAYDSSSNLTNTEFKFANRDPITLGAGTFDGTTEVDTASSFSIGLVLNDPIPLGTLSVNFDPGTGLETDSFKLADGFTFELPTILSSGVVHAVSDPLATPLEALTSYLSDLGFTFDLNLLNSTYLHPEGDAHTLSPSVSVNSGGASVTDSFAPDAPGTVITGHSQETVNINGTPTTLPVSLRVIGGTFVDLSKDQISNIDLLDVTQGAALTADQFLGFSTISGVGLLHAVGGGSFNLQNGNIDPNAQFNLTADTWEGTLLTGDDRNGEVLTASLFGDDTLTAGNGNNDKLYAGLGVDTLIGGTGTGMEFHAEQGLAVGSTVTGNGASDVLYASGDLSHVTISGIETLDASYQDLTISAAQLGGIGSVIHAENIHFTGGGSFNFSKFDNIGFEGTIVGNGGATLTAGTAGGYALHASDSGNDTLIGSSAGGDTMIAGHGVVTMIANGADSGFEAQFGLAAGSVVQGHGDSSLITHGDLTQSSVSGINAFELLGGNSVTMSGTLFNALNWDVADFGTEIANLRDGTPGDLKITTAGNYALTLLNGSSGYDPDQMFDMTALSNGGTTLREDHATGVILTASASGNDTLISNHSDFVTLDASGTSGTKTLTMDQSTNGELAAEDSTGTIVFNSTNNTGNILDAIGSTGAVTFNAATDTGDEIFTGNGTSTVYAGLNATIYGGDGTDTVVAGFGNTIYGGDGNDTYYVNIANQIYGGTGNDLFVANLPFDQYTVIDGGGGANSLYVNNYAAWGTANDISLADISNVTTLTDNALNLSMTADQLAGFSTLTNTTGTFITETLIASSAGTFSLAGKTVNGSFNLSGGLATGNVTLIGSNQNNQVLTGGLGTTTLQAGNGSNDTLIAGLGGGSLIGGAAADTFVLGGVSGLVQLALANGNITYNGSTQVMTLGNVTTTVQYGQNATIVGSDGTMSVNNNASGGVSKNTINWTAGGSRVEQFYTLSGGAWKETDQQLSGANGTGSVLWADTVIHNADGSLHVDISGTGGVSGQSNAAFAAGNGTSATLTGDYNSLQIGDNSTIVFAAGADHDFAFCGSNNTVTFNGIYESFIAYGGYNTLYLNGDGNTEQDDNAVDGDNSPGHNTFVLNANHNTLSLSVSNDVATVSGNNNSVILRKSNDAATVNSGTGNYIGDEGTGGNAIVLNGTGNTAQLKSSGTLTMGGSSNFAYCTDSNTVTVGGTSDSFITYGHGNTVTVTGSSDTLTDASTSGANTISLTGSSSTANINNSAGDTLTVGGTNNTINVNVAMTAAGTATISGTNAVLKFSGATTDQVTFSSGASGKLVLNSAQSFAGTVAGLASGDSIDLKNFHFSGSPTISNVSGTGAQGTATNVTVTDGALSVTLALMNQYANQFAVSASAYALSADGAGGNAGTLFQLAAGQ